MLAKILIVDDEKSIREMVGYALKRAGYEALEAPDGREAQTAITDQLPDLVLMDWMLPDTSGIELVRRLRGDERTRDIPIIMLTARTEEHDRITGLDVGADDYVTKPFSPRELVARIGALLRRASPHASGEPVAANGLVLHPDSHRVTADGEVVEIGPTEFRLLLFFMTHVERVYSRSQLLDMVWGANVYIEERTVDVHIRRLRKCLSKHGYDSFVQTVRGVGYRFSTRS